MYGVLSVLPNPTPTAQPVVSPSAAGSAPRPAVGFGLTHAEPEPLRQPGLGRSGCGPGLWSSLRDPK